MSAFVSGILSLETLKKTEKVLVFLKDFFLQIVYFKVRNSRIRQLPDYIFMGLKIVHLMLFDCGMYLYYVLLVESWNQQKLEFGNIFEC